MFSRPKCRKGKRYDPYLETKHFLGKTYKQDAYF